MSLWQLPWVDYAILLPAIGGILISRIRNPYLAANWGLFFTAITLLCTIGVCFASYSKPFPEGQVSWSIQKQFLNRIVFEADNLSAPLLLMVALLHFLTAVATARTKMRRFSFSWSLIAEAIRLATFACRDPLILVGLLLLGMLLPFIELMNRNKPMRLHFLHMILFTILLVLGYSLIDWDHPDEPQSPWGLLFLLTAILVRCGVFPVHCWVTDWVENASFGNAILFLTPLTGVYAALRLIFPIAPDWILQTIGVISVITAVYSAGMATIQTDGRRFFAYLFLSHSSLVLVGFALHTATSLTGALCLWISVAITLTGLGLTMRALEARFGRLSLATFQGWYEHSPTLAVCFLLTGFGSVGFPGTLGFISAELLIDGAVEANFYIGLGVVLTAALNGIAVIRAYFLLFTGTKHQSSIALGITSRERIAVLTLTTVMLGGGLFPQPGVASRYTVAEEFVEERQHFLKKQLAQ
jgi:NADH-quinone oxidoreductase subunit M